MVDGVNAAQVMLRATVMGTNKVQNQDWSALEPLAPEDPANETVLLAVADGHGAKQHLRSDLGARFAVAAFRHTAARYFGSARAEPVRYDDTTLRQFREALSLQWRRYVVLHAANNPPGCAQAGKSIEHVLKLYGTTLIGVIVAPHLCAAWQIGDGELCVVGADRRPRFPLAPETPDLGDETESLCSRDAAARFRVWISQERPALVAASTDGLSKSFATHTGIDDFCAGLFDRLERGEAAAVRDNLPGWLRRAADHSGDDTTLCALYRPSDGLSHAQRA